MHNIFLLYGVPKGLRNFLIARHAPLPNNSL